jgi:two-component system OmpR family response regulator
VADSDDKPTRVLVVDDNQDAAETLSFLLASAGYQVETRFDGASALVAAEEFEPDVCVLDLKMPGMDGYELARRLRAGAQGRPLVLATVTAYRDFDHVEQAEQAGFDLYFTKPAEPGELAEQLHAYLLERRASLQK